MSGIAVHINGKNSSSLFKTSGEVRGKGDGVGPAIAGARELVGMTCEQLAEEIGIPCDELALIEAGEKQVAPELLLKLAEGLKLQMELTFDMEPEFTMGVKFKK